MKLHSLPPAQRAGILVLVFFLLLSLSLIVRFSQPSQQTQQQAGGTNPIQQENQLPGTTNWYLNNPSQFSNYRYVDNAASWIYAGTNAKNGDVIGNIVGYEWDNTSPTANVVANSSTHKQASTLYQAQSGAWVFDGGTIEWSWGLDSWGGHQDVATSLAQSITKNILDHFVENRNVIKIKGG